MLDGSIRAMGQGSTGAAAGLGAAETNATLVRAAQADPEAFGLLYDRYVDTIYRYLYRQTGAREVAEDLTSLTFMRALGALDRFPPDRPVAPWLVRIAHNALVDHRRRAGRTVPLDDEIAHALEGRGEPGAAGDLEQAEVFDALTAGLPVEQRDALALRFVADLSMEQTAAALGRSLGATKMIVTRALATVRARERRDGKEGNV